MTHVVGGVGTADGYTRAGSVDGTSVHRNADALGAAYVVPGESRLVATDARLASARPLTVSTPTPERVTVTGEMESGLVVVSQTYYPLWRATADGAAVTPVRTETGLLAVPVESGTERVTVRYRSWPLRVGAGVSALGVVGVLAVLGRERGWWTRLR